MVEVCMNKSSKLVCGIGVKGMDCPTWDGEKPLIHYTTWGNMLLRCTKKSWIKRPRYKGTICSENFKSYSFFYEWCNNQIGFGNVDERGNTWHLDKDLLVKGNKIYSEDTCVFVPHRINVLLTKNNVNRGGNPVGVSWFKDSSKYMASCGDGFGNKIYLGLFDSKTDAFIAYKTCKEDLIKRLAETYKNHIDHRTYTALNNYEVHLED